MLTPIDAPDHVVAFRMGGKVRRADVEAVIAETEARLERHPRVAIYAEVEPVEGMTFEAMSADLRYALPRLDRFGPVAVVTDETWIAKLTQIEGWLLPAMGLRVFARDQADRAFRYACEGAAPGGDTEHGRPEEVPGGLRRIATSRPDAFAFEVSGHMGRDEIEAVVAELDGAFDAHPDGVDLLARIRAFPGFDVGALRSSELWRMKARSLDRVRRYAIVGGPGWLSGTATFLGHFLEPDIRYFEADEEERAWEWIGAEPADTADRPSARARTPNHRSPWRGAA